VFATEECYGRKRPNEKILEKVGPASEKGGKKKTFEKPKAKDGKGSFETKG